VAIAVLAVNDTLTAAVENDIANQLNTPTLVGTVNTANTATSTGVTEALHANLLLAVTGIVSGQNYWVEFSGHVSSTVSPTLTNVQVHALQGTVLVSSPIVAELRVPAYITGDRGSWRNLWTPAASGAWNLQVGVKSDAGANGSFGPGALNARLSLIVA
jgi:hypothetical protein